MHRVILEVTIKVVLDIDTDAYGESKNGTPMRKAIIEQALDDWSTDVEYSFSDTDNASVHSTEFISFDITHK